MAYVAALNDDLAAITAQIPAPIGDVIERGNVEVAAVGQAVGLQIGQVAPDFELADQLGRPVRLSDRLKRGPVVLVFYRGDWCPYCNLTLRRLSQSLPDIDAMGGTLLAVSPQSVGHAFSLAERAELDYEVLSDPDQATIRAYALHYAVPGEVKELLTNRFDNDVGEQNADGSWNLPVPGTYVIDRGGVIRARHVDVDYRRRMEPVDINKALACLPA